jgi:CheY-like chemotaxis protein
VGWAAVLRGQTLEPELRTAYARSEDRDRALRSGFQLHLAKPVDPDALLAALESVHDRSPRA